MPHVTLTVYFILTAVNWAHWLWIHHLFLWCTVKTSVGTFLSWWSSSGSHEVICGDSDFLAACVRCDCCLLSSLLGGFHMWHVHNRQYHLLISQSVAQAHGRNSIWGGEIHCLSGHSQVSASCDITGGSVKWVHLVAAIFYFLTNATLFKTKMSKVQANDGCRDYKRARRARQSLTGGGSTGVLQVLLFLLKQRV